MSIRSLLSNIENARDMKNVFRRIFIIKNLAMPIIFLTLLALGQLTLGDAIIKAQNSVHLVATKTVIDITKNNFSNKSKDFENITDRLKIEEIFGFNSA